MVTSIEVSFALLQNPVKILHFFSMNMLVKCGGNGYRKREPRFLQVTETEAGTARCAPPCTTTCIRTMFYDLGPS